VRRERGNREERRMDTWKFYDITHREHVVCNPMSEEKIGELVSLLRLERGARVVDIASGKGEFLIRLIETYGVSAVGVDVSPYFVASARGRAAERVPSADLVFEEQDGAKFVPGRQAGFDLASCLGASWIFGGHRGTLEALAWLVVPGGWIVAGEPFWRKEPSREHLDASGDAPGDFGTHVENVAVGEELGLSLVYTFVSSGDDWDRYQGLQWLAAEGYARSHPDDPDLPYLAERVAREKETYLRWERDTLGWAIYVFRKNGE